MSRLTERSLTASSFATCAIVSSDERATGGDVKRLEASDERRSESRGRSTLMALRASIASCCLTNSKKGPGGAKPRGP